MRSRSGTGVLELRLKKRDEEELAAEEGRALESGEREEGTAKVKEKIMLKLKKQKKTEKPAKKKIEEAKKKVEEKTGLSPNELQVRNLKRKVLSFLTNRQVAVRCFATP